MQDNQSQPVTLRSVIASTLSGTWPKVVLIVFAVELVFLFLGSTIPISQSTANLINSQNSALASTSDSLGLLARALFIFTNNIQIALLEFVPILGWFFFGLSMYNTALAIEVIGIAQHLAGPLLALSLLFQPHTWLELPTYAIATTQSFYLISTVARRDRFKFEAVRTGVVLVIVAVELIIAAFFESLEISLASSLVLEFVAPWLLFAVLIGMFVAGRRLILKDQKSATELQRPMTLKFCTKCGARVHEGAFFCDQCGEKLPQDTYQLRQ